MLRSKFKLCLLNGGKFTFKSKFPSLPIKLINSTSLSKPSFYQSFTNTNPPPPKKHNYMSVTIFPRI